MALTNEGKRLSQASGLWSGTRYVSLHLLNDTELSLGGYSRRSITAADRTISSAGIVTGTTPLQIYIADGANAQVAFKFSVWDASSGGNMLYEVENIDSPPATAPVDMQGFNLTNLTFNP